MVIGSANSAVDVALETWRKGAEVTMVIREKQIGENVKYWVRPGYREPDQKRGRSKHILNPILRPSGKVKWILQTPKGKLTVANDFVLAMTGYLPILISSQQMGIKLGSR